MPKAVGFSPDAERDLEDIADYIARDNPARALSFVRELRERCENIGLFPRAARAFPALGEDAHVLPVGHYVIFYRNLPADISIERIIHGARDIMALIASDS